MRSTKITKIAALLAALSMSGFVLTACSSGETDAETSDTEIVIDDETPAEGESSADSETWVK